MSDQEIRDVVEAQFEGIGAVERIARAGDVVEMLSRELTGYAAQVRADSVREALALPGMDFATLAVATGLSATRLRALRDRSATGEGFVKSYDPDFADRLTNGAYAKEP